MSAIPMQKQNTHSPHDSNPSCDPSTTSMVHRNSDEAISISFSIPDSDASIWQRFEKIASESLDLVADFEKLNIGDPVRCLIALLIRNRHPPAARLVGIELNPGPGPAVAALASLASVVSSLTRKKKKTKQATRKKTVASAHRPMNTKIHGNAPVSMTGNRPKSRTHLGRGHTMTIPFSLTSIYVWFKASLGKLVFTNQSANTLSNGTYALDLNPIATGNASTTPPLGIIMRNLALNFSKYRIVGPVSLEYNPVVNTSQSGSVVFGCTPDPWSNGIPDYTSVGTMSDSEPCAVYESTRLDISKDVNREWLVTYSDTGATINVAADQRLSIAAQIWGAVCGVNGASDVFLGTLTLKGSFEFLDLVDRTTLGAQPTNLQSVQVPTFLGMTIYQFGSDGTACTATAPFGSGNPKVLYSAGNAPSFSFTPTTQTCNIATSTYANEYIWHGLTMTGNPSLANLAGGITGTGCTNNSTTASYYSGLLNLGAVGDGLTMTGPTTLTKGICIVNCYRLT